MTREDDGRAHSLTPRARELVSVLKGTPTPDSPWSMDLLNRLLEEEAGRRPTEESKRVSYKEFKHRWAYHGRQASTASEAPVETSQQYASDWQVNPGEAATQFEAMLKEAQAS